jgi:transposase InsO family protein
MKVAFACRLFGHCRQAFYQSKADMESEVKRERVLLEAVNEIRSEDPGIGGYKLWLMLAALFGSEFVPGRDSFYRLLRRKGLMLVRRKSRSTTNSNHRYHKWKNVAKGFVPTAANQLWVSDITYILLADGDVCYLHLITDAYSHKIVGWVLSRSLRASGTIGALEQAIAQSGAENLAGLIHHSDRGVQYCCDAYVSVLQKHGITISMTEDYKPTDNAVAERVNGIIKGERLYRNRRFNSAEDARNLLERYIHFYNYRRPHMSIGYKIPAVAHLENGPQERKWKKRNYLHHSSSDVNEEDVSLPSRTTSQGEGICRRADKDGAPHRGVPHLAEQASPSSASPECRNTREGELSTKSARLPDLCLSPQYDPKIGVY